MATGKEFPIAEAMRSAAALLRHKPAESFICYWTAFTNISQLLAARAGVRAHFGLRQNGTLRIRSVGNLKMAEVYPPRWERQMEIAFLGLSEDCRHQLVSHANIRFFAFRTPVFNGEPVNRDAHNQQPNGVLDIACMLDPRYPIWSPIDVDLYRRYVNGQRSPEARDALGRQALDVIGVLYRNLVGAGPLRPEADDELIGKALPLVEMVVVELLKSG